MGENEVVSKTEDPEAFARVLIEPACAIKYFQKEDPVKLLVVLQGCKLSVDEIRFMYSVECWLVAKLKQNLKYWEFLPLISMSHASDI